MFQVYTEEPTRGGQWPGSWIIETLSFRPVRSRRGRRERARNPLFLDLRYVTHYDDVIRSIRRGVIREHALRLRDILARLDAAGSAADMDLPGFRLHPLKGDFKGFWAVTVRANWRVIIRFVEGDALDVDYIDYH